MKIRTIPDVPIELRPLFWSLVDCGEPSQCWLWTGGKSESWKGHVYGVWNLAGGSYYAHRIAYTLAIGVIPDGLTIDHVRARGCTQKLCCNPAHLEAVTFAENLKRRLYERRDFCNCGAKRLPKLPRCRDCNNAFHRKYRADHPEKMKAIAKASYERIGRETRATREQAAKPIKPLRAHDYFR